jgi:hypothetical protein
LKLLEEQLSEKAPARYFPAGKEDDATLSNEMNLCAYF